MTPKQTRPHTATIATAAAAGKDIGDMAPCRLVRLEQERRWREEHADFAAAWNAVIEAEGLPLSEWRNF